MTPPGTPARSGSPPAVEDAGCGWARSRATSSDADPRLADAGLADDDDGAGRAVLDARRRRPPRAGAGPTGGRRTVSRGRAAGGARRRRWVRRARRPGASRRRRRRWRPRSARAAARGSGGRCGCRRARGIAATPSSMAAVAARSPTHDLAGRQRDCGGRHRGLDGEGAARGADGELGRGGAALEGDDQRPGRQEPDLAAHADWRRRGPGGRPDRRRRSAARSGAPRRAKKTVPLGCSPAAAAGGSNGRSSLDETSPRPAAARWWSSDGVARRGVAWRSATDRPSRTRAARSAAAQRRRPAAPAGSWAISDATSSSSAAGTSDADVGSRGGRSNMASLASRTLTCLSSNARCPVMQR